MQPLHFAAQCTRGGAALVLLAYLRTTHVDFWACDGNKQTVLHHAGRAGAGSKVLDLLLSCLESRSAPSKSKGGGGKGGGKGKGGAQDLEVLIDAKDAWGRTALHWAALNGHGVQVQWLLDHGADDGGKDLAGETALEMAERRARCGAKDRNNGERASTFGGIAKMLGGSGGTKNLKAKGY